MNDLIDDSIKRDVRQLLMVVEKLEQTVAEAGDIDNVNVAAMVAYVEVVLNKNQFVRLNGFPPKPAMINAHEYRLYGDFGAKAWVKNLRFYVDSLILMCDIEGGTDA